MPSAANKASAFRFLLRFKRSRSSPAERSFDMGEAERAALSAPHHFCPCGVVQTTCLPLMQEITGAKPVRDTNFTAPAPKHFERCTSLVWKPARCNSGWGLQFGGRAEAPQSSQRSGRFHTPAVPRAALGTATIYASLQQPVDFFCKEIVPGQHRREAPI